MTWVAFFFDSKVVVDAIDGVANKCRLIDGCPETWGAKRQQAIQ